jgi:exonuclease III
MNRTFSVCCWNVRGLGDHEKCGDVLMELLSANHDIVLLQETKLSTISPLKMSTFLPRRLNCFHYSPSDGASGGILTAWAASLFSSVCSSSTDHTLSVHLTSTITNFSFIITNVYAPSTPELRAGFLTELQSVAPLLMFLG